LNGSIDRFKYLSFREIRIITNEDNVIEIYQYKKQNEIHLLLNGKDIHKIDINRPKRPLSLREEEILMKKSDQGNTKELQEKLKVETPAYFPAFRTMIEAWASNQSSEEAAFVNNARYRLGRTSSENLNTIAREFFGRFVPNLSYRSLDVLETELTREIERATFKVAKSSQDILSEAFVEAFNSVLLKKENEIPDSVEQLLDDIDDLYQKIREKDILKGSLTDTSSDVYGRISNMIASARNELPKDRDAAARVLAVYRKSLREQNKIQTETYAPFEQYVDSVNKFLEGKQIAFLRRNISLKFEDQTTAPLQVLSSGERQIVSMLYAASPTLATPGNIVLIDEPEISLHLDWQRKLLGEMMQQLGKRQIIVCTHSPEIGANYLDAYQEVLPQPYLYGLSEVAMSISDSEDVDEEQ
jgi:predicted ATP-binding protein involved in virulence